MDVTSIGSRTNKRMAAHTFERADIRQFSNTVFEIDSSTQKPVVSKKAYYFKRPEVKIQSNDQEMATKADIEDAKVQILIWGSLFFIACTPMIIGILKFALS